MQVAPYLSETVCGSPKESGDVSQIAFMLVGEKRESRVKRGTTGAIGAVYAPPELHGRGYAGSVTAAVVEASLRSANWQRISGMPD